MLCVPVPGTISAVAPKANAAVKAEAMARQTMPSSETKKNRYRTHCVTHFQTSTYPIRGHACDDPFGMLAQ